MKLDLIAGYSRAQAIEDGQLVDVSECVTPHPFKYPVAMTIGCYTATIAAGGEWVPDGQGSEDLKLPNGQDVVGRMHDVFQMLLSTMRNPRLDERQRKNTDHDRVYFTVLVDKNGNGHPQPVRCWSLCGPGDDAAQMILEPQTTRKET